MAKDRFTVAFDDIAIATMTALAGNTHLKEPANYIRSSVSTMSDLLDARRRKLSIVFRDDATGREWAYDPFEPGKAAPIQPGDDEDGADNVYRPSFGRRSETEMVVGECAFEASQATSNGGDAEGTEPNAPVPMRGRRIAGK